MAGSKTTRLILASLWTSHFTQAIPWPRPDKPTAYDPFKILDPQAWVNPDNMTWSDFKAPPNTNWSDPSRKGSIRNLNIALVAVDYPDEPFVITLAPNSTVFNNPQAIVSGLNRSEVPNYYRDLLNTPSELNRRHTLHEYWMEDSAGQFGVDLKAFGAYRLPRNSYQYGVDDEEGGGFNPGACPSPGPCSVDLRTDALEAWRADVGNKTADAFELVFILSAGQDESSTWQEFGEMKFQTKEDVSDAFGPPDDALPNYAATRYVEWSSWASSSTIWPNAGGGSSTQGESSGMAVYAHELSHLLGIGDNYNNPFGVPERRSYTGPWSMLSRGSFNGPGGPHTRWQIPALQGSSMGSLHTVRDKLQIGLITDNSSVFTVSREYLVSSAVVVVELQARSVDPGTTGLLSLRVDMGEDLSPFCNVSLSPFCDGGGYNNYEMEVIDRMGADSFTPDSGVMISKTKNEDSAPFQWTIDANPQDINVIDFYRPNGTAAMLSIGDYRQLADALFHAGTRSGSEYEHVDEFNRLHFYILNLRRDDIGVLHYTVGAKSLDASTDSGSVEMKDGKVGKHWGASPTQEGVECSFKMRHSGPAPVGATQGPERLADAASDVFRLSAEVNGDGWRVELPNGFAFAKFGEWTEAKVAVGASEHAARSATVKLTATSELDPLMKITKSCKVHKW